MTSLDSALAGVSKLGLDTSPFIYLIERNPTYLPLVRHVFRRISSSTVVGYSSMVTLAEVLTQPLRLADSALAQRYRRFLTRSRNIILVPIDSDIAERAAVLRASYTIRTPDAFQIAAAIAAGCTAFLTNDIRLQRVIEIQVLVLDHLEV